MDKPIPEAVVHAFVDWLAKEMQPGTYITSPEWWASRIIRQIEFLTAAAPPSAPVGVDAAVEHLKDRAFPNHQCPAESSAVWNVALYEMANFLTQQPAQAAPVPCDAIPKHQWEVLSCEPNEYEPTMESGWQRCKVCGTRAHFNRERTPPGDDAAGGG